LRFDLLMKRMGLDLINRGRDFLMHEKVHYAVGVKVTDAG
jgi:hypothetical protein